MNVAKILKECSSKELARYIAGEILSAYSILIDALEQQNRPLEHEFTFVDKEFDDAFVKEFTEFFQRRLKAHINKDEKEALLDFLEE